MGADLAAARAEVLGYSYSVAEAGAALREDRKARPRFGAHSD